ncbi:MAG: CesT family type III secretion system chaperone [Burkholderiaceae bacterium]
MVGKTIAGSSSFLAQSFREKIQYLFWMTTYAVHRTAEIHPVAKAYYFCHAISFQETYRMSRHCYVNLIDEFCKLSGLGNSAQILQGGGIELDGVNFSVIYSEKINPDWMFIYCDFGDPPKGREIEAYQTLLKQNLFFYKDRGPVFTISPDTGRILLAQAERPDETTPHALLYKLDVLSARAQSWRKNPLVLEWGNQIVVSKSAGLGLPHSSSHRRTLRAI